MIKVVNKTSKLTKRQKAEISKQVKEDHVYLESKYKDMELMSEDVWVKSIRVGNFIFHKASKKTGEIYAIVEYLIIIKTDSGECFLGMEDDFCGIPLTRDVLKKSGFTHEGGDWFNNGLVVSLLGAGGNFFTFHQWDKIHNYNVFRHEAFVNTLHRLQNVYFDTRGEDLSIKL